MRIRHGWSGEYRPNQWGKFDVSLDEEDLYRLLEEASVDGNRTMLTTTEAYIVLNAEAQRLLIAGMMARYEYPRDQGQKEITAHGEQRDAALRAFKAKAEAATP